MLGTEERTAQELPTGREEVLMSVRRHMMLVRRFRTGRKTRELAGNVKCEEEKIRAKEWKRTQTESTPGAPADDKEGKTAD